MPMERLTEAPLLRIQVLGPPQVLLGDTPVTFARRKALALLAYLTVTRRPHSRDALATLLADAATDEEARGQFRSTLLDLRRQVSAFLVVDRDTIALARDGTVWLDLAELKAAAQDTSTSATTEWLARAVSLYRGALLAGLAVSRAPEFEDWLLRERERVQVLHCRVLSRLVDATAAQGDLQVAISWARRRLEEEPWHEPTHRQLMRLLGRTGQREAALAQYETCRRLLADELGTAPQEKTTALYEQLRAGPTAPPTNLPAPPTGFVGREAELALIAARLADPACRLLTLLGLGGSGKTSLALRAAAAQAEAAPPAEVNPFADGVYLVDLASVTAPGRSSADRRAAARHRLGTAIGRVLGLELRAADPVAQLARWLHERAILLLLDNLEHLLAGADLLGLLLTRAPRLKLLVTSRERLGLPEEWVLEVGGLPLPSGPDDLQQAPASCLYLQLLRQAGQSTPPAASERSAIVRICELTQGLPLALVLAARWAPVFSAPAIAQELATGMDLLGAPDRQQVPARQRSMRAVLQATWVRLMGKERVALRRLAVFQPGFTREAAQAVAEATPPTLLMLGKDCLIDSGPTGKRYAIHELVRQYAAEQLARHPEEETETRARHATYYAALVQQLAPALRQTVTAQEAISAEIANIRLAWDWAVEHADAGLLEQMLAGFAKWHEFQGLPGQAAEALERAAVRLRAALAQCATPDLSMQRLLGLILVEEALALSWQGAYDRALPQFEEALQLAQATGSPHLEGRVSYCLGWQLARRRDLPGAMHWTQQALAVARAAQISDLEADALQYLATRAVYAGEYPQARGYLDRALPLYRAQQHRLGEALVSLYRGLNGSEENNP
jgi:DNA-binding SARP family transcriptional activator/predicted ATPase